LALSTVLPDDAVTTDGRDKDRALVGFTALNDPDSGAATARSIGPSALTPIPGEYAAAVAIPPALLPVLALLKPGILLLA
jgi:hypothetical protein